MKIMKKILILFVAVLFISCDENENTIFDNEGGQALAVFNTVNSDLPVTIDEDGTVDIEIGVTTVSSADRSVTVTVDDEASTADTENYSFNSTITIPAGEYIGILTVDGVDTSVEASAETIVFNLASLDGGIVSTMSHKVSIFQICPVPDTYLVGNYTINDLNGTGNFPDGETVSISVGSTETARVFETVFLPATVVARDISVDISLACNIVNLASVIDINVQCTAGIRYIIDSAGDDNASYSLSDDNVITVNYLQDPNLSCTGGNTIQSFTLTKI